MDKHREPFDLYRIEVPPGKIKTLPPKTRRVYHLAGTISNELNELNRLALMSLDQTLEKPLDFIAVGRGWVVLRVLIGKTFEAFQFVEDNLKETGEFYKDYLHLPLTEDLQTHDYLERHNRSAYRRVWDRINVKRGLLSAIRNKIAFHYKLQSHLDEGFDGLDESWDQAWYQGGSPRHAPRHASFNAGAESVIVRAMLAKAVQTGALGTEPNPDLKNAMEELADETLDSSDEIADLMETLILCILNKHDIKTLRVTPIKDLNHMPSVKRFRLPPFLRSA